MEADRAVMTDDSCERVKVGEMEEPRQARGEEEASEEERTDERGREDEESREWVVQAAAA